MAQASTIQNNAKSRLGAYELYVEYCKSLGLTAASAEDYKNTLNTLFRLPEKYSTPWDEFNSLPVLTWPKELGRPEKKEPGESKDQTKLRTGLNRAFRDVPTDAIVKFKDFSHPYLLKRQSAVVHSLGPFCTCTSFVDHRVARERGHDPNTPFVLDEINHWLLSLDNPGLRPMMTGQGSFWDGWDCDAWLTQEYAEYSTFLASQQMLISHRLPWLVTPKERWKADYRHRRVWRLFRTQKSLERRIFDAVRERLWTRPASVLWNGPFLSQRAPESPVRNGDGTAPVAIPEPLSGDGFAEGYRSVKLVFREVRVLVGGHRRREIDEAVSAYSIAYRKRAAARPTPQEEDPSRVKMFTFMQLVTVPDDKTNRKSFARSPGLFSLLYVELSEPHWKVRHKNDRHSAILSAPVDDPSVVLYNSNGNANRFFDALAKWHSGTKDSVYLCLQKRWREGKSMRQAQLYIGRTVRRARRSGETNESWTALSMNQANRFVIQQLRARKKVFITDGGYKLVHKAEVGSQAWLKWTMRLYALNPKNVEGHAREVDAHGHYVLFDCEQPRRENTAKN
ncbi:MAG: hypothetical protein WA485_25055 [Candidatus Sulfotelmatobacter sp.]